MRKRYEVLTRCMRGRSRQGGRSRAVKQQRRGRGGVRGRSEGGLSGQHGTCEGEVGEEGV